MPRRKPKVVPGLERAAEGGGARALVSIESLCAARAKVANRQGASGFRGSGPGAPAVASVLQWRGGSCKPPGLYRPLRVGAWLWKEAPLVASIRRGQEAARWRGYPRYC